MMTAIVIVFASFCAQSQIAHEPGKIIRQATTVAGRLILDPDGDQYVKKSGAAAWTINGDDTTSTASEIHYRAVLPYGGEPCCDLRRGPDHRFSDFVPDNNNNGVYLNYVNGGTPATSYLKIRMRMGTIIPGSKGFSLLIDTDSSFGYGVDANYVAKTTGINGNPGFEIEVVLETGFRVAIYNVDGRGNPNDGIDIQDMGVNAHRVFYDTDWEARSQVSFASTTEAGDPDYFIDWYVTLEELQKMKPTSGGSSFIQSAFQRLRIIPTTIMAPKPSVAGPISDVYGSNDTLTITYQPKICLPCEDISGLCTAAPVVTSAATSGSNNVKGTWTKSSYGGSTATIYIYKNNDTSSVLQTVTNVSSGSSWQATVAGLVAGDIVFAKAKGNSTYESRWCFTSNRVPAGSCDTRPNPLGITTFADNRGIDGTNYPATISGGAGVDYITLWKVDAGGLTRKGFVELPSTTVLTGNNAKDHFYITNTTTKTWTFNGGSGGPANTALSAGQYLVYDSTTAGCLSAPTFACWGSAGTTDVPTITSNGGDIYTTTTTITGAITAVANYPSTVRVYLDSVYQGNATVTNAGASNVTWSYTFTQTLTAGKKVWIRTQKTESGASYYCEGSLEKTILTACVNNTPVFNVDSTTSNIAEGVAVSGTGTPGGTVILKKNGNTTTVATMTVGTDGTWSATNTGTTLADGFTGYARIADVNYTSSLTTTGCATASTSLKTVSAKTSEAFCSGSLQFSTEASTGGSYSSVVSAGALTGTSLTSDAKWIKGTLGGSATANSKTVKLYLNDGLIGRSVVSALSLNWPDIYVGGMLTQGDILKIAITENDGSSAEMVCASIQIICDCATANKPTAPAINLGTSTVLTYVGGKATLKISDPQNNNFYSVKNKYTGRSLSKGTYYTGGNVSITGRFFGPGETLTIETIALDSSQTATIVANRIGGTETCTESVEQGLVVNNALPVFLTEFKGVKNGKSIVLSWTTATEIDFSHFEIERSADGISFDKLAIKAGVNQLSGPNYYSFTDNAPLAGNNFYRLKMVDLDGRFEYSKVLLFKNVGPAIVVNSVRPNPFVNELSISALFAEKGEVSLLLSDASGRTLVSQTLAGEKGLNELKLGGLRFLPAGTYFLNVVTGTDVLRFKVLKVNQ